MAEHVNAVQRSIGALAGYTNNTASGNGNGDAMVLGGGTLSTAATLGPANAFNGGGTFVLRGTTTIGFGGNLGVQPGTVFKADLLAVGGVPRAPEPPFESRFLKDSHLLWDLSAEFKAARVVRDEGASVIVDAGTNRFIVRAREEDHLRFEIMWRSFFMERHGSLKAELLRVGGADLGYVHWTREELERIAEATGTAISACEGPGGGDRVRLTDPDGFVVELNQLLP